jgi:hypothetical protein
MARRTCACFGTTVFLLAMLSIAVRKLLAYSFQGAKSKDQEGPFADYLHALFDDHRLDLIVTLGAPAASFVQEHRPQLFPSTPMLLMSVEQRRVALPKLTANDTFVVHSLDIVGVVENILRVLPDTTNIAVLIGNSPIETYWLGELRDALQPLTDRVAFSWFNELSFDGMLKRVAALPPRSAILFAPPLLDAGGIPREEGKTLTKLHAVANAPIFSYDEGHFGGGIVAGPLIAVHDVTRQAAAVAVRILSFSFSARSRPTSPINSRTTPIRSACVRRSSESGGERPSPA